MLAHLLPLDDPEEHRPLDPHVPADDRPATADHARVAGAAMGAVVLDPAAAAAVPAAAGLLDDFVAKLLARLGETQRPQSEAYSHMELEDPRRPLESSVIGSALSMIPYKPPVNDHDLKSTIIRQIAVKALEGGVAIRMIEVRFRREGKAWQHEITMELAENHKRLRKARKPLDEAIAAGLREVLAAQPEWDFAALGYNADPGSTRPGLHVVVRQRPALPVTLVPGEALAAAFAEVAALHSTFGRRIKRASWHADRDRPGKCSVDIAYG